MTIGLAARRMAGALVVLGLFSAGAAQSTEIPPEAFGALPVQSGVQLCPDGHYLAWADQSQPKARVVMFDLVEHKTRRILAVPEDTKIRGLLWQDNETLLILLSETKRSEIDTALSAEYTRVIAHDVSGGDGRMLPMSVGKLQNEHSARTTDHSKAHPPLARLLLSRTSKPHTVIMATYGWCNDVYAGCLLEVDTRTGAGTVIKVGNNHTVMWVVDRQGEPVARADWDFSKHAYRVYRLQGDSIREIMRMDDSEPPNLTGLSPDGSALVLLAANGRPHQAAWAIPLDGSPPHVIAEDDTEDISGTYTDPYTGSIVGVYMGGIHSQLRWLDPDAQHRYDVLHRAFPDKQVGIFSWTTDGSKTIARVETRSLPPTFYLVDFSAHRADIAAEEYPALAGVRLGEVKEITYKARDGTDIPAYLTLPPEKPKGPAPLIVLPHGGPHSRDFPQFDWLAQFIASRGYTVLQPQFRGSTGFGRQFLEAGYRQWGGLMQNDVSDGVRSMIEQGVADPHRVCIVGESYGGYVALAGAAFTPDLYQCAVSINGIADLPALMREVTPIYESVSSTSLSYWKSHIGGPFDRELQTRSPINSIQAIKIPVLIVYGTGDGVVPTEQSKRMARLMSGAGKTVELVALDAEDHWLSHSESRVVVLKSIERFLKQSL